jgi:DNA polymerase-4
MQDVRLPFEIRDARPLRVLYLDLNAYFASVQQAENPELRGRPVGVCAVETDSSTLIAASYEAKAFGIKTGTNIGEARRLCPEIVLISGGHGIYTAYHQRILEAVESVLPIESVNSIDEMQIQLIGEEREPENARGYARRIKAAIRERVADNLACSIGVAPNPFLAKLATDLQKPDGLVVIEAKDLPDRLRGLRLTEFAGINRRMEARLQAHGIFSSDQMVDASREALIQAFGGIIGERWYYMLRGYAIVSPRRDRQSLSHSHVLPPELRSEAGCRETMLRLIQKATARLRSERLFASAVAFHVKGTKRSWDVRLRIDPSNDTVEINAEFNRQWEKRDFVGPLQVGVAFGDLKDAHEVTPSLFSQAVQRTDFNDAVDHLNHRFGKNTVFVAGMHHAKDTAEERIAFQKTELFDEGQESSRDGTRRGPFRRSGGTSDETMDRKASD